MEESKNETKLHERMNRNKEQTKQKKESTKN